MTTKILLATIIITLLVFPFVTHASYVKTDDLVIQDDGNIELVIGSNAVLGAATSQKEPEKTSAPQSNSPQTPEKTVPLVAPHTETTVQINPPINNGKEVQVIITTRTAPPSPSSPTTITTPTHAIETSPATVITKNVDQVVAQGANGKPVITIKSEKAHELTIQQGSTQATTALPLTINTLTHSLSVPTANQPTTINVLPTEALQGILSHGLLNTQNEKQATIHLMQDASGINYIVGTQEQGKLFGIYPVSFPVQVKLSAQNGKVIKDSQSLLFSILGKFIK